MRLTPGRALKLNLSVHFPSFVHETYARKGIETRAISAEEKDVIDETYARKGIETLVRLAIDSGGLDETYARKGIETVSNRAEAGQQDMRLTPGRALKL